MLPLIIIVGFFIVWIGTALYAKSKNQSNIAAYGGGFLAGCFILAVIALIFVPGKQNKPVDSPSSSEQNIFSSKPAESAYSENTAKIDYRKAMLNNYPTESMMQITGKIVQVIEDKNLMIATKREDYVGFIENKVLVAFDEKQQVLEDDIVRVYGRYMGTQKYTTVLGAEAEVPLIVGDYLKILRQKN